MKLPPYLFWWEWVKKIIWDPFWWVILFLIILWVPFLRVWWWVFLPWMLMAQLKVVYIWWIAWDFNYATKQKWVFLEIIPPKELLMPIKAMEDMFASIWPIMDVGNFREIWCDGELDNGPQWCSWEIASIEGAIHFYVRLLQQHRVTIESALYGHYPDLEIHEAVDYVKLVPPTVPNEDWDMYGEDWYLFKDPAYPIKTYPSFFEPQGERIAAEEKRMDPIISLLEAMAKLGPGENYWVQFTTVPVPDHDEPEFRINGQKIINKLAQRKEDKKPTLMEDLAQMAKDAIMGPTKEGSGESAKYSWATEENAETGERQIALTPGEREVLTEVENKIKKPVFRTNIRGVYVAKRDSWSAANRVILRGYMGHFITENMNVFRFNPRSRTRIHYFFRERRVFLRSRKMFRMALLRFPPFYPDRRDGCPLLSPEEMATLYHLPFKISGMVAQSLQKIESKKAGPPPNLPIEE